MSPTLSGGSTRLGRRGTSEDSVEILSIEEDRYCRGNTNMARKPVRRLSGWGHGKTDLDPGIRDLVLDLNSRGYRTWASCEGGIGHGYGYAWLTFPDLGKVSSREVEEIKVVVGRHTSVPYRLIKQGKTMVLTFSKPLVLPEEEILGKVSALENVTEVADRLRGEEIESGKPLTLWGDWEQEL